MLWHTHGAYKTGQSVTYWELEKLLKDCYSIFKKSPARCCDHLEANNFRDSHEGSDIIFISVKIL